MEEKEEREGNATAAPRLDREAAVNDRAKGEDDKTERGDEEEERNEDVEKGRERKGVRARFTEDW